MDTIPRRRSGLVDIVSVLALYGILFAAMLVFSQGMAAGLSPAASAPFGISAAILIVLSASLLGLILLFVLRLLRPTAPAAAGGRFRARLAGYFLAVASLASIPQALVSWQAVGAAAGTWFNARIEAAAAGAERLSLDYAGLMEENLKRIAVSVLPGMASRYLPDRPQALLALLQAEDSRVAALQAFSLGGQPVRELAFAGQAAYRENPTAAAAFGEGALPSIQSRQGYAIRYLKVTDSRAGPCSVLLSMEFPSEWSAIAEDIHVAARESAGISAAIPRFRAALAMMYFLLATPLVLTALLFALVAADKAVKPLASLERATAAVAAGDLSTRLLTRPRDDFSGLITAFNRMVAELSRSRSSMAHAEKLSAWQDIAQKLAHEIKNPLTPIRLSAERVLKRHRTSPGSASEIIEPAMLSIIQEVDGLSALLEEFRDFARLPEPQAEWTDLGGVAAEVARSFASSHPGVRIELEGVPAGMVIRADRGHLRQMFMNLFMNAIEAMSGQGRVSVRSDLVKRSDSSYCRIQVSDTGPGIPADIRERLFTPYFTTKEKGTGLGLSIVEHIVMDHKGEIWFESGEGAGTTFFIDLPVDDEAGREPRGEHADRTGD